MVSWGSQRCVCGRSGWSSWFTLFLPSENCLYHSNTRAQDMQSSPYTPVNNWKVSVVDFFSLTRNLMLTCSLSQSDIFWPRIRTCLYLKMRPLVPSKAIELSLVTLWHVRTCSIAVCLSLTSHCWFLSYRVSLVFFCVGPCTFIFLAL
jgi:hypothetical protein